MYVITRVCNVMYVINRVSNMQVGNTFEQIVNQADKDVLVEVK